MRTRRYPSGLTDAQWPLVAPHIPPAKSGGGSVAICRQGVREGLRSSERFRQAASSSSRWLTNRTASASGQSPRPKARLAADVAGDVKRSGLALAQRVHHLEAPDCGVGRLQRLEATDGADQLLQLTMVGLDHVVQVLGLSMDGVLRAFTLLLQLGERRGIGRRLVRVDDVRQFPVLQIGRAHV